MAQAYYHPWHAYVDGKPTRLWRANYAFQALEVPAGNHQIQVVYEDKAFKIGGVILFLPGYFAWLDWHSNPGYAGAYPWRLRLPGLLGESAKGLNFRFLDGIHNFNHLAPGGAFIGVQRHFNLWIFGHRGLQLAF